MAETALSVWRVRKQLMSWACQLHLSQRYLYTPPCTTGIGGLSCAALLAKYGVKVCGMGEGGGWCQGHTNFTQLQLQLRLGLLADHAARI